MVLPYYIRTAYIFACIHTQGVLYLGCAGNHASVFQSQTGNIMRKQTKRIYSLLTKHPKHPECDWLCMVADIKEALFYSKHFNIPNAGVGTDGEQFWLIEETNN